MQLTYLGSGQTSNRMARKIINAADDDEDDEYIDIEVNSSPQAMDFGFQMTTIFPAKHFLYKGKPLHPTLQIVHNLLQTTATTADRNSADEEDFIVMDFARSSSSQPSKNTCRLSFELNIDDNKLKHNPEKSWCDKLRLMKKSVMSKRLQASRAYLRSLFGKSACKDVASAKAPEYKKVDKEGIEDKVMSSHRSFSFSSAETKWLSPIKCLASSSSSSLSVSFSSSEFNEHKFHKRSYSFTSDIEGPIDAAIAHCKKSQQLANIE